MLRIIVFLLLIALAAAGAAWVADQTGDVVLSWGGWRVETALPVFALGLGLVAVAAVIVWTILRALWRMPAHIRRSRRERRQARGRHAVTQGLLAIGHGDSASARAHAETARRHAAHDPLALLLHAQSAQLDGDREGAQRAFR
ncbi:MAG TPA: heme biosynthesis HemY N-terminal domain-containing protein, partial [Sphingomonas sp.]|nr:heme biosynthesis HemY N-terminal domain-containing protein [Sphingomonas sp.]